MSKKNNSKQKSNYKPIMIVSVLFLLVLASLVISQFTKGSNSANKAGNDGNQSKIQASASNSNQGQAKGDVPSGTDLKILKSEVTGTAKFYPYKADNVYMEAFAVKASDGTVRTALNTCQVCYSSGKGYYVQKGDTMVCQNCGNVFKIDQIEKVKNGCNPVPITVTDKKDDGNNIVISKAFMDEHKNLFLKWRK